MDRHTLAIICIVGSSLDVLGAMYLAYDLLGGEHGPLRTLTRGVTYGALFTVGFGLPMGLVFGLAGGITHGLTLALEFSRASRGDFKPSFWQDAAASTVRGIGFGIGTAWFFGPLFGVLTAAASAGSQIVAYRLGVRPTMDYSPAPRPRITKANVLTGLNRTVGYGVLAGLLCRFVAAQTTTGAVWFGARFGLTIGLVTAGVITITPLIEYVADCLPERRMGVTGIAMILVGFALQSVQYWLTLLDVTIR